MFSPQLICSLVGLYIGLFVSEITQKQISMGDGKNPFNFGMEPDKQADPGITSVNFAWLAY